MSAAHMAKKTTVEVPVTIEDLFGDIFDDFPDEPATLPEPPPAPCGPEMLDCGHWDWYTAAEHESARAAGHCCTGGRRKIIPSWIHLRGEYRRPIPAAHRRTKQREAGPGFSGYCCDDEGWYIGGIANDCRRFRPEGARLCASHRPEEPKPPEPPEPEPDVEEAPEPRPAGTSWKQRQLDRKQKQKRKR